MNDTANHRQPLADGATADNSSNNGMDWHRRAGPVFKYGLISGFALVLLGGMSFGFSLTNSILEIFVICAGLSIILGAFGSTATLAASGQGVVLVGVAGIAAILFMILLGEMNDRHVRVKIGGDVKGSQMDFIGDASYFGAFQSAERTYDFIVFGRDINRPVLALYVELPDGREIMFECIKKQNVRPFLGSGKTIEWSFDTEKRRLTEAESHRLVSAEGKCPDDRLSSAEAPSHAREFTFSSLTGLIRPAFAQTAAPTPRGISALIDQLESNASYERRQSRLDLANGGVAVVEPLFSRLSQDNVTYRTRLGVIVALTEMMRQNKANRTQIIAKTTEDDLKRLVDAAADEDRTIRIYATEFLYDLADPRTVPIAFNKVGSVSDEARYSLLFVVKGSLAHAPNTLTIDALPQLTSLKSKDTPKTNELIESIQAMNN